VDLADLRVIKIARHEYPLVCAHDESHSPANEVTHLFMGVVLVGCEFLVCGKVILHQLKVLAGVDNALNVTFDDFSLQILEAKEWAKTIWIQAAYLSTLNGQRAWVEQEEQEEQESCPAWRLVGGWLSNMRGCGDAGMRGCKLCFEGSVGAHDAQLVTSSVGAGCFSRLAASRQVLGSRLSARMTSLPAKRHPLCFRRVVRLTSHIPPRQNRENRAH